MNKISKEFESDQNIEVLGFFRRAKLDNVCDYCDNPQNGTYLMACGTYEYPEDECICGKCIVDNQKRNQGRFNGNDLPEVKLPF